MLAKPNSCKGCPFYGDGRGFVPDEIREAEVLVMGQNPGSNEEEQGKPFVGDTGQLMEKEFLPMAGYTRDQVSIGNAIRCRYHHANELPQIGSVVVRKAIEHCHRAHFKLPAGTKLIVAQGEYCLLAMTQHGLEKYDKVGDWRGYVLPFEPIGTSRTFRPSIWTPGSNEPVPVLSTYHLAYLFRDFTAKIITKWDWSKIPKILKGSWPRPLPKIQDGPPHVWPLESAFDTEFVPFSRHFLCYSLAYPSVKGDGSIVVRVSDKLDSGIISPETTHTVIMQNATADIPFLDKMLPGDQYKYEDIMHAHAVLWSDFDHDLNFMGSLYASINRWKHLDKVNPKMYSAGDAFVTWEAWQYLKKEFDRDAASLKVYREYQLPLVKIIMAAEGKGVRVNQERAKYHYMKRLEIIERVAIRAQAVAGWPINLRSNPQVGHQLYEIEGLFNLLGMHKSLKINVPDTTSGP